LTEIVLRSLYGEFSMQHSVLKKFQDQAEVLTAVARPRAVGVDLRLQPRWRVDRLQRIGERCILRFNWNLRFSSLSATY